jgi:hypothetical protein
MTSTTAQPVAKCGCPIPPEVASGEVQSLGWHLTANHLPEVVEAIQSSLRLASDDLDILERFALWSRLGWPARQPTVEECELVDRETSYAEPLEGSGIPDWGDYVIETPSDVEAQTHLARALELFGMCDAAHVIPAGVYLEG